MTTITITTPKYASYSCIVLLPLNNLTYIYLHFSASQTKLKGNDKVECELDDVFDI